MELYIRDLCINTDRYPDTILKDKMLEFENWDFGREFGYEETIL